MKSHYPTNKHTIIGGGIIGALEAYFDFLEAKEYEEEAPRVTVYEKNPSIAETTTSNIVPSLTPDEILAVVPRGQELVKKLKILFNQAGGIRVDDVKGVNNPTAEKFIKEVEACSVDEVGHKDREKKLLELGKFSMELWQKIYDTADDELKKIFQESNFNPCKETRAAGARKLHDGYRIDLINVADAKNKAQAMKQDYESLSYVNCKLLSPKEVKRLDPSLIDFCDAHSEKDASGKQVWKNDAVALYRPGGCLDTGVFLPKFYTYLEKIMGTYDNDAGKTKNRFRLKFSREVKEVTYEDSSKTIINGLKFADDKVKHNKHEYKESDYTFCPGEAVGTLDKLGFKVPAFAGFAGASLRLNIPLPADKLAQYANFSHCMEVHQEGVVLAWQARRKGDSIFIGVAGTKAFYSDQKPDKNQAFAKDRNLLQLNIINQVLPDLISIALGRPTKGEKLTQKDLDNLEEHGIAKRWVGTRAVAFEGFPTLGFLHRKSGEKVANARVTTHLGSGGVSFAPAAVSVSRSVLDKSEVANPLVEDVLKYANSARRASR